MKTVITIILAAALTMIVACNDDPTSVSITTPLDTVYHFDTTFVPATQDTIWCKYVKRRHNRGWVCLDVRPFLEDDES